jgi:hypothetical protein
MGGKLMEQKTVVIIDPVVINGEPTVVGQVVAGPIVEMDWLITINRATEQSETQKGSVN